VNPKSATKDHRASTTSTIRREAAIRTTRPESAKDIDIPDGQPKSVPSGGDRLPSTYHTRRRNSRFF
jgi:hypothetical protein